MKATAITLAVVMVAGLAAAQGAQQQYDQPGQQQFGQQQQTGSQYQPLLKAADDLIGMSVKNNQGESLGTLAEIVLEPNLNYVSYGVLSRGGFVGIGENYYAIPWDTFQLGVDQDTLILNIPEQAFAQAQGFDKDRWPDRADQRWRMQVATQGAQPMAQPGMQPQPGMQQQPRSQEQWREDQYREQQQWRQQQQVQPQARTPQRVEQPDPIYGRPEGEQQQPWRSQPPQQQTWSRKPQKGDKEGFQSRRVTQLLGMDVQSFSQQEQLGDLEDVVLDFPQGLVAYGVISLGGGDKAAIPWSALEIRPMEQLALVEATRQTLEQVAFSGDELPNLSNPQYAQRIHSQFNREPYWEVLGFVGGPQMQRQPMTTQPTPMRQTDQPMMDEEPLTRHFDPQNITVLTGTVEDIGMFDDPQLAIQGQRLHLRTQDGQTVVVHVGPRPFLQQHGLTLQENDQVQVRGSFAQIGNRTIFIASDIRTQDATVQLRDQQGKPLWRGMGMERGQGMGRGVQRQQQQW